VHIPFERESRWLTAIAMVPAAGVLAAVVIPRIARDDSLRSVLVATAGLSAAAVAAAWLALSRPPPSDRSALRHLTRASMAALLAQAAHFVEEWLTGFPARFPPVFGLAAWPAGFFVTFNIAWLAIWVVSVAAAQPRRRLPLFPLWFLGLASAANGVAHPFLAVRSGGYFPGLLTSPIVGVTGLLLIRALARATGDPARPSE
jgi:hypothetical protein